MKIKSALKKLCYEISVDRTDFKKELFGFEVINFKTLCKELHVQVSGATKAELAGQLLLQWQVDLFTEDENDSETARPS